MLTMAVVLSSVVGQPDQCAVAGCHVGQGAQVVIGGGGGIAAHAMQHNELGAAVVLRGGDGFGDFVCVCHAGGDNHGLAGLGDVAD